MNTIGVDAYLRDGCGRCDNYRTPACKVHRWTKELEALRALVVASGLSEEMTTLPKVRCWSKTAKSAPVGRAAHGIALRQNRGHCSVDLLRVARRRDETPWFSLSRGGRVVAWRECRFGSRFRPRSTARRVTARVTPAMGRAATGAIDGRPLGSVARQRSVGIRSA